MTHDSGDEQSVALTSTHPVFIASLSKHKQCLHSQGGCAGRRQNVYALAHRNSYSALQKCECIKVNCIRCPRTALHQTLAWC